MDRMDRRPQPPVQRPMPPAASPLTPPTPPPQVQEPVVPVAPSPRPQPIGTSGLDKKPKGSSKLKKIILSLVIGLLVLIAAAFATGWVWYQSQLAPVDDGNLERVRVTIELDTSPAQIATLLKEEGVIRSTDAFSLYTRLSDTRNSLQAGSYRLSPSESTPQIVDHLTKGNVDTFDITFLPGATLEQNRKVFLRAGFSEAEIDAGFSENFSSPLFDGKPATADLEGYIYGETYRVSSGATVANILQQSFTQFEQVIEENSLKEGFARQGLSLFEGITLASIIQRESGGDDEAQIAQVFFSRLAINMPLGSDVTYQYIADKTGVARDTMLESPYNTRIKTGLTPGPIAAPGKSALLAVANPAEGDYLYFLSGDDDVTYYARDLAGHEANIANHCKVKCQII